MAEPKLLINNKLIDPSQAKDMMLMLGFEDTEDTTYLDLTNKNLCDKKAPIHDKYLVYYGSDDVFLTVSNNRNLLIFVKFEDGCIEEIEDKEYDYVVKMFTFSGIGTELQLNSCGIEAHKEDDYIHVSVKFYKDERADIYIPIDL